MDNHPRGEPGSDEWRGMTPRDRGLTTPVVDDVFTLLSDWRRRDVCLYFAHSDTDATDVETLATAVAQRGTEREGVDVSSVSAIEHDLVEVHLPRLDQAGVLDFDELSEAVRYWGQPTLEKWAEHAEEVSRD